MAFYKQQKKQPQSRLKLSDIIVAIGVIGLAIYLGWQKNQKSPSLIPPNTASSIRGMATINDGDTLTIKSERIRLLDIDAPELHQMCAEKSGKAYACGKVSKQHLIKLINRRNVVCHWNKRDKYERSLGYCFVEDEDDSLNRQMVLDGWAVSYNGFPNEEREALEAKRGLWKTDFQRPRQWRNENMH